MFWVGLAVGIFLGAPLGLVLTALLVAARDEQDAGDIHGW